MSILVVTGTDTGVGKTWVSLALIAALRARGLQAVGLKPVASGAERTADGLRNADALALQAMSSPQPDYAEVNPYVFEPAIAPHIAAWEAGVEIRFQPIVDLVTAWRAQTDIVVVEAVGGWRVPLGRDGDVAALARLLGLPVLLVIGVRLGCLSHALLTADAIRQSGLPLAGWVANLIDPDTERLSENLDTLRHLLHAPCLGVLPHLQGADPARLGHTLDLSALGELDGGGATG